MLDDGFDVGQGEPLTARLHGLVREYPKGLGIMKEFVQNADDAGASTVRIWLDRRHHSASQLPKESMRALSGPAVVIANDKPFTDDDLKGIQRLGQSVKVDVRGKTGRFGVGFNAVYNVTDFPSFLTGGSVYFFDPHRAIVPCEDRPGRGWPLSPRNWDRYRDIFLPFSISGLRTGQDYFDGAAFRLPLRTKDQAAKSEICNKAFGIEDFRSILEQLHRDGPEMLLFLKHVTSIHAYEVSEAGTISKLLTIDTENEEEVRSSRNSMNDLADADLGPVLCEVARKPTNSIVTTYLHDMRVTGRDRSERQLWRIVSGIYLDPDGTLREAAESMREIGEKALPWVGAATRLELEVNSRRRTPRLKEGQVYCFLPLSERTDLPIHINGFFDLNSSRHGLTSERDSIIGKDAVRVTWNKLLAEHCVARAYSDLLKALAADIGQNNEAAFFAYWPELNKQLPDVLRGLPLSVYRHLEQRQVIPASGASPWTTIGSAYAIERKQRRLYEALVADNLTLMSRAVPDFVIEGFCAAGIKPRAVDPKGIRDRLRTAFDIQCKLEDAERPCLRRRDWVTELLRFCLGDGGNDDLQGLPLAILGDGLLHTFGHTESATIFLSGQQERTLFPSHQFLFVDEELAKLTELRASSQSKIGRFGPSEVVAHLRQVIPETKDAYIFWDPPSSGIPNENWLAHLFRYLTSRSKEIYSMTEAEVELLHDVPLIPDQFGRLWKMGTAATPLLARDNPCNSLIKALTALGIPVIVGKNMLVNGIRKFAGLVPGKHLWKITPCDLVDTMDYFASELTARFASCQPAVCDTILDFLSEPRAVSQLRGDQGRIDTLKGLCILPTQDGRAVRACDPKVYLPADYHPPALPLQMSLLRTGKDERWQELLSLLQIRPLDRATLIREVLLPSYAQWNEDERYEALSWLRDYYEKTYRLLKSHDKLQADALRSQVDTTDLLRCSDGIYRPICQTYYPERPFLRNVLGSRLCLPDLKHYSKGRERWARFFRALGTRSTPDPADVVRYIDDLVEESRLRGSVAVMDRIEKVFTYLNDNWEKYHDKEVELDHSGEHVPLEAALRERAWLPAERCNAALQRYPGYSVPEDRLYKPAELHRRNQGHLIASQSPIECLPRYPDRQVAKGLGFPTRPRPGLVLAHFDLLLDLRNRPGNGSLLFDGVRDSLLEIYRYFGELMSHRGGGSTDDETADEVINTVDLAARYADHDCLCSPSGTKLWKPIHTFASKVRIFEPRRLHLCSRDDPALDRGYEALGRREAPVLGDYVSFLKDLYEEFDDHPLPEKIGNQVLSVWRRMVEEANEGLEPLPVLTRSARLAMSDQVYVRDVPWYDQLIQEGAIEEVDPRLGTSAVTLAAIPRLSEALAEELVAPPIRTNDPELGRACLEWQKAVRSAEFRNGLLRLLYHEQIGCTEIDWLANVVVEPVQSVDVQLVLKKNKECVGGGAVPHYFDRQAKTIFLAAQRARVMETILAQAINSGLRSPLSNWAPLVTMLGVSPQEISPTLNALRISPPPTDVVFVEPEEPDGTDFEDVCISDANGRNGRGRTDGFEKNGEAVDTSGDRNRTGSTTHQPSTEGDTGAAVERDCVATSGSGRYSESGNRSANRRSGQRAQVRAVTYVFHGRQGDPRGTDIFNDELPQNAQVGIAAVERVLAFERSNGRNAKRMVHNNPGYDVESRSTSGDLRYVEVKGVDGAWGKAGVPLSPRQYAFGKDKGSKFWLYVVEYARDEKRAKVWAIQDPVSKITQFRFDSGWSALPLKESPK